MNMKKKPRLRDLLRAAFVVLFSIGVPVWLLVAALIVNALWLWIVLIAYVVGVYFIAGRFEYAQL